MQHREIAKARMYICLIIAALAVTGCLAEGYVALPLPPPEGSVSAAAEPNTRAPGDGGSSEPMAGGTSSVSVATENCDCACSRSCFDDALARLYEQVNPSVVNIGVVAKLSVEEPAPTPAAPDTPRFHGPGWPQEYYQRGEGSGFVYDKLGHIVTNNHVVAGADKVQVTFANDVSVAATIVGMDPDSDLAVIKVEVDETMLNPLPLGDSDGVVVGQRIVAIGNPFGLDGTMTTGIVSALSRVLPSGSVSAQGARYSIPDVIQVDAAINPGNSGGPLLDFEGRVVGVNAAIESPGSYFSGVGFAIPVNILRRVVPSLIAQGYYEHPRLGVSILTVTAPMVDTMGLPGGQRGVLVADIVEDGPAVDAGLIPNTSAVERDDQRLPTDGDVIVSIDDQPIRTSDELISYLARKTTVGQKVRLGVLREGATLYVTVRLGARPRAGEE